VEVARVGEQGWGRALGEREEDLNAVAVPVLDRGGKLVAILGAQGPAGRFSPRVMRSAVELLIERAEQISLAV
jgi:IclR family acetate operon transcriptional repressor